MSIIKNAIESIQVGLEDFENKDPKRSLSAARNISAGILLLFKEKLRLLSPKDSDEVLIKKDVLPKQNLQTGEITFEGTGSKTVDVYQIKERFRTLKIDVDWKTFDNLNKIRNNIEHYYVTDNAAVINEIVSKSFIIIRDFCIKNLDEDPATLFGVDSWNIFLKAEEIYNTEKAICEESIASVDWSYETLKDGIENLRCPSCQSDLIMADGNFEYTPGRSFDLICRQCQDRFDMEEAIEELVKETLYADVYLAMTDGGDEPYDYCPECGKSTYVFSEDCCLSCGHTQENKVCALCHTPLDLNEASEGNLCSYHRNLSERDD